ncbi:MAG: O-antigen ligase family protein [Candidatus Buchananbacteria bacterium]|jgi:O-antigen ligase/Tfp pilus assembly protein PilF
MGSQKILKNILLWGSLAVLWTPLIFANQAIFPYISPKNFFFRLLTAILAGIFAIYILQKKKLNFSNHKVFSGFLVFLAVNLLAAIFAVNPGLAFFSTYERMGGWFTLFFLSLFFLIIINVFETKDDWLKLFRSSLICSAVLAAYALIIKFANNIPASWPKNGATLGNIDFLGAYLMLSIFLGLILVYLEKNNNWRIAYGSILVLNAIVLLVNAARAGILGLAFGLFVIGIFAFARAGLPEASKTQSLRAGRKIKYGLIAGLIALILFGGLAYQQKDSAWVKGVPFLYRFTQISFNDPSTVNRLLIWQVSWQAFMDRPILGYGPENAVYGLNKHVNPKISEMWFDRAHNFIFDTLLASGIIGLFSYLAIFILAFWLLAKNLKRNYYLSAILIGSLSGFLVSNLLNFDTIGTWLPLVLILAFIGFWAKNDDSEDNLPKILIKYDFAFIGAALFALVLAGYFTVLKPAYAGYLGAWATAYADGSPDKAIINLDKAINLGTYGNRELAFQLSEYDRQINESDKFSSDDKKKYFETSEKALLDYLKSDPHNFQAKVFLALLYQSYAGENSFYAAESIKVMEEAKNDSPQRKEIYNILAQGYYLQGNPDKAIENLKLSLAINNWEEDQYLNLINILSQKKEMAEMDKYIAEFLVNVKNITPNGYKRLGQYYFVAGKVDEAERVVRDLAIPADPDYLPTRIALSSIYESRGEYDRAINYVSGLIQAHPEWADTINDYIKYLEEKKNK